MTTSPNAMAYQAKPDQKLDGGRFFMTPEVKTRQEAKAFCDDSNGQLFAIETTTDGELWIKSWSEAIFPFWTFEGWGRSICF